MELINTKNLIIGNKYYVNVDDKNNPGKGIYLNKNNYPDKTIIEITSKEKYKFVGDDKFKDYFKSDYNYSSYDYIYAEPVIKNISLYDSLKEKYYNPNNKNCYLDQGIYFKENGNFHNFNGPAEINKNGDQFWYQDGRRHRLDGPAMVYANGDKHWYRDGKLHRTDGPAIEYANGDFEWFTNGKLHCTNGTSSIDSARKIGELEEWYHDGQRHRVLGPAVVHPEFEKYFYQGRELTLAEYQTIYKMYKLKKSEKIKDDNFSHIHFQHDKDKSDKENIKKLNRSNCVICNKENNEIKLLKN